MMLDTTVAAISSLLEASCHMLTLFPFFTEDSAVIRRDSTSAHVPLSKTKVPLCPHPNPSHLLKDLPPAFPTSFSFIFIFHFPLRCSGHKALCKFQVYNVLICSIRHCKIFTTIALANISIRAQNYHFLFVVRTFQINSLSSFQV